MRVYSIQERAFIEAELFARSEFRPQDDRTSQCYYIDEKGLIHSRNLNYSLLFTESLSIADFKAKVEDKAYNYHSITIY